MITYHKIDTLYLRDETTKKLIFGRYRSREVEMLKDLTWVFTEKIDGTNVRVHWDGHQVEIGGRTDKGQLPEKLSQKLTELFLGRENEQIFEQNFGEKDVYLFGEGYGKAIQAEGVDYSDTQEFVLIDVKIGNYLDREGVTSIAKHFNLTVVPIAMEGTINEAIQFISGTKNSTLGKGQAPLEGLVGVPLGGFLDKRGRRIITKLITADL